jgi:hypothetical protein
MSEQNGNNPDARNAAVDGAWTGLVGVSAVALVIGCCGGVPLLAALAGSVAVGTFIGIAAGAVALVALVGFVVLRSRRRAACGSPDHQTQPGVWRPAERAR